MASGTPGWRATSSRSSSGTSPAGIGSIRGFEARSLGPREAKRNRFGRTLFTDPVGGSVLVVINNEIIFPLVKAVG
jgi:outer membrane protein assembly factor BamA